MADLNQLQNPPVPNLPLGPYQYERQYQDQFSNVLRLYFNRLQNALSALFGRRGGRYLNFPYAAIQRTTDKLFTANTATQITFDQNDFLNGCANDGTDGIVVDQTGLYNYQFSIQFANTDSQAHTAWVWLRINGTDLPGTGSKYDVPSRHGSSDGYVIAVANFFVQLTRGDRVELYSAVDQAYVPATTTGVYMEAYAAQTSPFARPSIPAVVATLSFVSGVSA